jgi:hypothetical protein
MINKFCIRMPFKAKKIFLLEIKPVLKLQIIKVKLKIINLNN